MGPDTPRRKGDIRDLPGLCHGAMGRQSWAPYLSLRRLRGGRLEAPDGPVRYS